MSTTPSRGAFIAALLFTTILASGTARAQTEPAADSITALENRIEAMQKELDALRAELDALKGSEPEPAAPEPEDLMAIEPLTPAEAPPPAEALGAPVVSAAPPRTGNLFNPAIAVVGHVVGHAGDENPHEPRDPIAFDEAEIALEAAVDPYAKAKFFIAVGEEEVELEEGYAQFVALPWDLTAKAGKLKASFGKFNLLHAHNWSWADAPLVHRTFFGEEGLADAGVSASRLISNPWDVFLEATAEVYRGSVEDVFEPAERSDLLWVGHLRSYRDLSDAANLELGGSFASGGLAGGGRNEFTGVDLTYRWRPPARSIYRSLLARTELIWNDRDDVGENALGLYASADYQFARRWTGGIRLDRVERPEDPSLVDRGGALTLTFRPSEFSQIRGELRRTDYADGIDALELLLQLQFSIGAHAAHPF
ncbi:MAG: hypothetical protein ACRD2J_00955 [Thermoanaerobaculia bacterium]